jgi:hypothetical protein
LSAFDVIALYSLIFSIAGLSNYRWKILRYIYSGIICDEMAGCLWFRSIVFFYISGEQAASPYVMDIKPAGAEM